MATQVAPVQSNAPVSAQSTLDLFFDQQDLPALPSEPATPRVRVRQAKPDADYVPASVASFFSAIKAQSDMFDKVFAFGTPSGAHFIGGFHRSGEGMPGKSDMYDPSKAAEENLTVKQQTADLLIFGGYSEKDLADELRQWDPTVEELHAIHEACLKENLSFLASVDRKEEVAYEKGEILQWIFTVDQLGDVHVRHIPFSFHNCCLASGLDPEELRDRLLQTTLVRQLLVKLSLYKAEELPPLRKVVIYAGPTPNPDEEQSELGEGDEGYGDATFATPFADGNRVFIKRDDAEDLPGHRVYNFGW